MDFILRNHEVKAYDLVLMLNSRKLHIISTFNVSSNKYVLVSVLKIYEKKFKYLKLSGYKSSFKCFDMFCPLLSLYCNKSIKFRKVCGNFSLYPVP